LFCFFFFFFFLGGGGLVGWFDSDLYRVRIKVRWDGCVLLLLKVSV